MTNNVTPTTPTAPKTPTTVTIIQKNGATFSADLHNLSVADSEKLYDALGYTGTQTNYQELADQVAGFAHNFKSIVSVGLPAGMSWQQAMTNLMRALKEGGGKISEEKDKYLKELAATPLGQSIMQSGIYKTAEGTAAAIGTMVRFGAGLTKPVTAPFAVWDATTGTMADFYDQVGFGMNEAQAKAIGTAYAAALYSKVDAPAVHQEPNMLDKALAGVQAGVGSVWHMIPPKWAAYFTAIGKWFTNGYNWDAAYKDALAEETVARQTPALSYEQTLERNLANTADKQRPEAAELLRQAQNIAGIETAPVADIVKNGGVYRDRSGTFQTLDFQKGAPVTDTLKDDNNQPLTLANRTRNRAKEVWDAVAPNSVAEAAGEGIAVAVIAKVEQKWAPLRGMWNGVAHMVGGALKLPVNAVLGVTAGLSEGTAKVVSWVLPNSTGSHASVVARAVEQGGDEAAAAAAKLAKERSLTGEARKAVVEEARNLRRAEVEAAMALDQRNRISKALDVVRPAGDATRKLGSAVSGGLETTSRFLSNAVDSVRDYWFTFDTTTPAEKAAREAKFAAEAAMGNVSQETLDAAKAARASTWSGKFGRFFSDLGSLLPSSKLMAGESKVAREIVEGSEAVAGAVAKGAGVVFKGGRWVARAVPVLAVGVLGAETAFASGAHAESIDGTTLGYREQLVKDYIVGRISPAQYTTYKNLQDYYLVTGLGGIVTAGVVEGVQGVAGELVDKASVVRYLPGTIVDTIRTVSGDTLPEIAPQQPTQLLTAAERLARINEVKQENELKVDKLDSRAVMRMALGGANPDASWLNSTIDWDRVLRSVSEVAPAPDKAVTSVNTATSLTPAQLLASHEGVIEQARMAVNRGSAPAKLDAFNLGTGFSSVDSTRAALATRTPVVPDSGDAQQLAGVSA